MEQTPIEMLIADLKTVGIEFDATKYLEVEKERDKQILGKWYKQGYSDAKVNLDCNPKQYLKEKPKYFIKPITEEGKRQAIINARSLLINTKQDAAEIITVLINRLLYHDNF